MIATVRGLLVMKAVYSATLIKISSVGRALLEPAGDIVPLPNQRAMHRAECTSRRQSTQFDVGWQRGIVSKDSAESFHKGPQQRRRYFRQGVQCDDAGDSEFHGRPHWQWVQQAAVDIPAAIDALRQISHRHGAGCEE